MRTHSIALSLLIAATATAADDGKISDLRLGFYGSGTSASKDAELTNASTGAVISSGTTSDDADSHGRFSIGYVGGEAKPVGMIFGIGLAFDMAEYTWEGTNDTQTWSGVIVDFELGVATALNENIHFEATGVLGFGSGTVEYDVAGLSVDPADAVIVEYGVRFGAYGTLDKLQIGLETGWMSTNYLGAEWELSGLNQNYSEDTEFSGAFIGLTVGVRL